jgi:hypothetical protein
MWYLLWKKMKSWYPCNFFVRQLVASKKVSSFWSRTNLSQRTDFFVREKVALAHVKQQQWVLVGTVKRIWLCQPEREHTLKHREQKNNRGVNTWQGLSRTLTMPIFIKIRKGRVGRCHFIHQKWRVLTHFQPKQTEQHLKYKSIHSWSCAFHFSFCSLNGG